MITSTNTVLEKIVEGIANHRIIPFFGAGMSKPLGLKDWSELTAELKSELGDDVNGNTRVAQAYEDKFGRNKLIEKLTQFYSINDITGLNVNNHRLVISMAPPIIYTTNYDEALELTAKALGRPYYKIASLQDIVSKPHKANVIVKFHGDFSQGSEIVLTDHDYDSRMPIQHPLDVLFRAHMLGKSILFMGYAMNDRNIDHFFDLHSELYGIENLPTSYLVTFNQPDANREKLLRERNIQIIFMESPAHLHEALRAINEKIFSDAYKKELNEFFQPSPQRLLLESDLENLKSYWKSNDHDWNTRAIKVELTLTERLIPDALQEDVVSFFTSITEDLQVPDQAMDIILRALFWVNLKSTKMLPLGLSIAALTERDYYRRDEFTAQDPLQVIEKLFGDQGTVVCLFAYLALCREQKKQLSQPQLQEIISTLRACKYKEMEFGERLSLQEREAMLDEFLRPYPGWKPYKGFSPMPSFSQMNDMMMSMMPKKADD